MFAIKHTADNRYRVNIGIVNPTAVASRFGVNMFDATNDAFFSVGSSISVPTSDGAPEAADRPRASAGGRARSPRVSPTRPPAR